MTPVHAEGCRVGTSLSEQQQVLLFCQVPEEVQQFKCKEMRPKSDRYRRHTGIETSYPTWGMPIIKVTELKDAQS